MDDNNYQQETITACDLCGNGGTKNLDPIGNARKCLRCGFMFISPRPTQEEIFEFYSKKSQYDNWLSEIEQRRRMWERRLNIILKYRRDGRLLDIGTGIGQFLDSAKKNFQVYGTEPSDEGRELAKKLYNLDISKTPNTTDRFDVITLFHVLEHVPSPSETIAACRQLLVPGGLLVIAVPNSALIRNNSHPFGDMVSRRKGMPSTRFPKIALQRGDEIHLSYFTSGTLKRLLKKGGFRITANSIDPYKPAMLKRDHLEFTAAKLIQKVLGINLYDTILMIAEKK